MRKGSCRIITSDPLGLRIKQLLADGGGICELARVAGVREATIYSWIKGDTRPTGDHLERLAAALHTTTEELLGAYRHPGHLTLDQVANLATSTYSGTQWASYGKLKSYIDTHGGELPPVPIR